MATRNEADTKGKRRKRRRRGKPKWLKWLTKHREFSKIITGAVLIYTIYFFHQAWEVMKSQQDFSSLDTLITCLCQMGIVALVAYAFRQRTKDKADVEIKRLDQINKMKKKYGDSFVYQEMEAPEDNYPTL